MLNWIVWNWTVNIFKIDLALNNLKWLICHKTKATEGTYRLWEVDKKGTRSAFSGQNWFIYF